MTDRSMTELAERIARLERLIGDRTPQLAHSSIEDGAILEHSLDGALVGQYGKQWDGTSGSATLGGPVPPQASRPFVAPAISGVVVTWDGLYEDPAAVAPMDFSRVEVHVSTDPSFDPTLAATLAGTFESPRGGQILVSTGDDYRLRYVRLVVRSLAGKSSAPSLISTSEPDRSVEVALEVADAKSAVTFSERVPTNADAGRAGDLWYTSDTNDRTVTRSVWVSRGGAPAAYVWERSYLGRENLDGLARLGEMIPYTPSVVATEGGFNSGTGGSLTGWYMRVGQMVIVGGGMVIGGAGFSAGTGRWVFKLPFTAAGGLGGQLLGTATVNADSSTTSHLSGFVSPLATDLSKAAVFVPFTATTARSVAVGGLTANSTPGGVAWAEGGYVRWVLTYFTADGWDLLPV